MENQLEERIRSFLSVSDGSGDGSGYGDGDGSGSGYGSGSGSGYGSGITEFNGQKVWMIDGVATIIESVNGNFAKGHILNGDFTFTPCYVAKVDNCFAHGPTLHKSHADAMAKALERMPLEKRIEKFKDAHPDPDTKIPARKLYDWHHTLTGSCEMGRNRFASEHGINIDTDSFTVREFVNLTSHSYGSEAIRKLSEAYGIYYGN